MRDRRHRHGVFEEVLRLFVQFGALGLIRGCLGLLDDGVVRFVTPFREVVAVQCVATEQGAQPVVRVTVIAAPANQHRAVFTRFGAFDVLAPFVRDDLGLDTDLRPVGLEHLGHQLGVGVIRTLNRHRPQGDLGPFFNAGFLEQRFGFLRVVARIFDGGVIRPLSRRHGVDGQLARTLIHGIDDLLFVHRHVQRLTYFQLGHRVWRVAALDLVHDVVSDVAEVETCLVRHFQLFVRFERFKIGWAREQGDLAFAFLELLHTHRRVGGDGEDQVVDFDVFRLPVILVAGVTDVRIFLVALEHKRTGADRLLVDVLSLAFLEQLRGVFSGLNGREAHGHVLDERSVDSLERELDGVVVKFLDLIDIGIHAHVGEVRELGRVGFAERIVFVEHAVEREQHVIGIEVTRRLEVRRGVELHPVAQMESVGQDVRRNVPTGRQPWNDRSAPALELAQTVEHGLG